MLDVIKDALSMLVESDDEDYNADESATLAQAIAYRLKDEGFTVKTVTAGVTPSESFWVEAKKELQDLKAAQTASIQAAFARMYAPKQGIESLAILVHPYRKHKIIDMLNFV